MRFAGEWKDLGTWNTLTEAMSVEIAGKAVAAKCKNTHVINELQIPLIALGVKDLAIAATPDGIFVSDKPTSSYLKDYVIERRPMAGKKLWGYGSYSAWKKHAVKAVTELHIIEVQVGDELTEDDIERLEWDWIAEARYIKNKSKQQR